MKSLQQAVAKAQKDLVRETTKFNNQRIAREAKAKKEAEAKAKAEAAKSAAPEGDGDDARGIELWELYSSMPEAIEKGSACRVEPEMPTDGSSWSPSPEVPTIIEVDMADLQTMILEEGAASVIDELPDWSAGLPSVADMMHKACLLMSFVCACMCCLYLARDGCQLRL